MNHNDKNLRNEFERYWIDRGYDDLHLERNTSGQYKISMAWFSWEAWKSAHAKYTRVMNHEA